MSVERVRATEDKNVAKNDPRSAPGSNPGRSTWNNSLECANSGDLQALEKAVNRKHSGTATYAI